MAEAYYKAINLGEGIFHIYEPGGVYSTLIIGEKRALLIDTGYGYSDIAGFVKGLTDKPFDVLLTHGHTDHCGACYEFPSVWMNMADIPTYLWYASVQRPMIIEKFKRDRKAAGLPDVWPDDFDEEHYLATKNHHFSPLEDGQVFDLGGRKETVIFMPGHTEGSVMVADDKSGLLFSGDNISDSLWIFFDTSASVSRYAMKLMDLRNRPWKGIVASHRSFIFPVQIMDDILRTIWRIDPETDSGFTHPRTGQKALKHREACTCVPGIRYIYVVYDRNKL